MPDASRAASSAASTTEMILALGSNRCHGRYGRPADVLRAAAHALELQGIAGMRISPILSTPPLGPAGRRFANAVLAGGWAGTPQQLLFMVKALERAFGRRPGRRWGARVLDIDIIACGQRVIREPGLSIPHPRMAERDFVLRPMLAVAPGWRHPRTGLTVRHMAARLARARPSG